MGDMSRSEVTGDLTFPRDTILTDPLLSPGCSLYSKNVCYHSDVNAVDLRDGRFRTGYLHQTSASWMCVVRDGP